MKKVILGAFMLLSGVIGFVGWMIACVLTVQPGATSYVWFSLDESEWITAIGFVALAVIGFLMAFKEVKREEGDSHEKK